MSTDFTGSNSNISRDSLYMMASDTLGKLLGIEREDLYAFYSARGKCSAGHSWGFYDRYCTEFDSNSYTGNKLADLQVLSACTDDPAFLDMSDETASSRRDLVKSKLSQAVSERRCPSLDGKLSFFPHLDRPDEIVSLSSSVGGIPCIEEGYEKLTPLVSFVDSCGNSFREPVPSYPLGWENDLTVVAGNDTEHIPQGSSFEWKIEGNADQVAVKGSLDAPEIEIAALSTAVLDDVTINVSFTVS